MIDRPQDEQILRHLGAAVLLCWHQLPLTVQGKILAQSDDVIGVPPTPEIRDEIMKLVLRCAPRASIAIVPPGNAGEPVQKALI